MRVLLVKPHTCLEVAQRLQRGFLCLEPLELEIVAGAVAAGDEVAIQDLCIEREPVAAFRAKLHEWRPDVVGFGGYSSNAATVKELAALTRALVPGALIVVGGIHATVMPGDYGQSAIDVVIRGEGGTAFGELLRRVEAGRTPAFDTRALATRAADFGELCGADYPPYPDIELVPAPRRDLVDRSAYFCVWTSAVDKRLPTMFPRVASVRTSVGCPFQCSFCVINKVMHRQYVQRRPEDVVDELAGIAESHVYFVDDEMFINVKRARAIADLLLDRGIAKRYISWARSDTICRSPELFARWREAGLDTVYVGLEAVNDAYLEQFNKKTSPDDNRRAVDILRDLGITLHGCFIVHPQFTEEDFDALEAEILRLRPAELTFTVLSPSPGTADWFAGRDQFICDPFRYYDCMHTVFPTRLPMRRFYARFARLYRLGLEHNPLRVHRTRVPLRDLGRAIWGGTRYIMSLRHIYRDYEEEHR